MSTHNDSSRERDHSPPATRHSPDRILFLTGRLAEPALRRVLEPLSRRAGFEYHVAVLPISVAALMHVDWLARKLRVEDRFDRAVLPGWTQGDPARLAEQFALPFELGPKDLHELPAHFGEESNRRSPLDEHDIEIIAEINHAPRLSDAEIASTAAHFRESGAEVIDVGCVPGESSRRAGEITRLLRREGHRVSIDSFDRREVEAAAAAGAELVLSCNSSNLDWASRLEAELVAVPDDPRDLSTLEPTLAVLEESGCRFRVDPVIEPIGFGFAASLARYFELRRRRPDVEIMMGVGNLTELTEVDSAGINVLLAGVCQELGVRSVLTTEVINWCRSAVREFDLARRLVCHAYKNRVLPKHVDSSLVMLRDPKLIEPGEEELEHLASRLTDPNFRIFAERGELHLMNRDGYWRGSDPYEVFDRMLAETGSDLDATHAFYLGYEFAKAVTALTLGKKYQQDEALRWGFLTVPEQSALERRRARRT